MKMCTLGDETCVLLVTALCQRQGNDSMSSMSFVHYCYNLEVYFILSLNSVQVTAGRHTHSTPVGKLLYLTILNPLTELFGVPYTGYANTTQYVECRHWSLVLLLSLFCDGKLARSVEGSVLAS